MTQSSRTGPEPNEPAVAAHREALQQVIRRGGPSLEQLWLRYFALGGDAALMELDAYIEAVMPLPAVQRDILALAANEALDEIAGRLRVPFSRTVREPLPASGPLTALVHLMQNTPRALSGDIGSVAAAAASALGDGVTLVVYVVDYELKHLVPYYTSTGQPEREPLTIEGTLAGRAYSSGSIQVSASPTDPRLWVPVVDGEERLGVLDVRAGHAGDVADPFLQEQCGWFASFLAHLITAATRTGDTIDRLRRTTPRTASAELIWTLLPPLTAGNETFTLSGLLEPAESVGGDAFDYALSQRRVHVAIFDAMGHSLNAGLIVTAALTAARAARRGGADLHGQARAVDEVLATHFPEAFATGILGELDLENGRIRYLAAGHPSPLLLRSGKVVAELDAGRRVPFGLGGPGLPGGGLLGEAPLGEAALEPGDWLVLYTDGVTEARDPAGNFFGRDRFVDSLERAASSSQPPSETVRRLIHSVLSHQNGVLQDDATVLLAAWQSPLDVPPSTEEPGAL